MKYIVLIALSFLCIYSFGQEDRGRYQQLSDSIMQEARMITQYDHAFTMTMYAIESERKIRREAGELLIVPKQDTLMAVVLHKKYPEKVIAEMKFPMYEEDSAVLEENRRPTADDELQLYDIKHKIMTSIQLKYDLAYGDETTFLNPIFIPYKDQIQGKEVQLYKLYLLTETTQANVIPFGQDYLFYARADGDIFYNLQFNSYLPLPIKSFMVDNSLVEIEYPRREPYITPTDIYLFSKYGAGKGLNVLQVESTLHDIVFEYTWDRDELTVLEKE